MMLKNHEGAWFNTLALEFSVALKFGRCLNITVADNPAAEPPINLKAIWRLLHLFLWLREFANFYDKTFSHLVYKVPSVINSLWSNDVIWWQRSGSTLAQVTACCLMPPSHYMNQCWITITEVLWHSTSVKFESTYNDFSFNKMHLKCHCKMFAILFRSQYVKPLLELYINGFVKDSGTSTANAPESLQPCSKS